MASSEACATGGDRQRFLRACHCQPVDVPPVWLMRQAGRVLPEYRALRKRYTFLQLVQHPELAAEVTLQPIRRFGFDAAIIFSDILVVPEALGQAYEFREQGGVQMAFALRSASDLARLNSHGLTDRLQYVARALRLVKTALAGRTALLGFSGSPWTLANFMLEGGSTKQFTLARQWRQSHPSLFERLMEKLTAAVTDYLRLQIEAGVDAVQIFDTLGGLLDPSQFETASAGWMRQIIAGLGTSVPVIVFAKGVHHNWAQLAGTGARVLGVDAHLPLTQARQSVPETIALQGNLDPQLLVAATPEAIGVETRRLLEEMRGRPGYVFNLGHGVPPAAKLENIERLVATVRHPL